MFVQIQALLGFVRFLPMYCLHNHLFLKFFYLEFSGLFYCSVFNVLADLFCLRQRDIYYHAHFNLSSTFLNFFKFFCRFVSRDNIHYIITTFITCQHFFSLSLTLTSQPFNKSFICCSTSMPQTEKEGFEPSRRSRDLHP